MTLKTYKLRTAVINAFIILLSQFVYAQNDDDLGRRVGIDVEITDYLTDRAYLTIVDGIYNTDDPSNFVDANVWIRGQTDPSNRIYPKLTPGKTYTLVAHTFGGLYGGGGYQSRRGYFNVNFDVPVGYILQVAGQPRTDMAVSTEFLKDDWGRYGITKYPIRLVKDGTDETLPPSIISKVSIGEKYICSIGLGRTIVKQDSGRLWIKRGILESPSIATDEFSSGIIFAAEIFDDSNLVLQNNVFSSISTKEGVVRAVSINPDKLALYFYRDSFEPGNLYATIYFTLSRSERSLLIERIYGPDTTKYLCRYNPDLSKWTLCAGEYIVNSAVHWLRTTEVRYTVEESKKCEYITTYGPDLNGVSKEYYNVKKVYQPYLPTAGIKWSTKFFQRNLSYPPVNMSSWPISIQANSYTDEYPLSEVILDPDGAALRTELTYYDDEVNDPDGRFGKVKSVKNPDLSWIKYNYYCANSGNERKYSGRLRSILRPSPSLTSLEIANEENCNSEIFSDYSGKSYPVLWEYDYGYIRITQMAGFFAAYPGTVLRKQNGIITKKTTYSTLSLSGNDMAENQEMDYWDVSFPSHQHEPPIDELVQREYQNSDAYLKTVTYKFGQDTGFGLSNRLHYTILPDRQYIHGGYTIYNEVYNYALLPWIALASTYHDVALDNGGWQTISGKEWCSTQTAIYDLDREEVFPDELYEMKSGDIMEKCIYDDVNRLVQKKKFSTGGESSPELYVELPSVREIFGIGSERVMETKTGVKIGQLDEMLTNHIVFTYDTLGRVQTKTIKGFAPEEVPFGGGAMIHSDITHTYVYDPMGVVLRETTSSGNLTLEKTWEYDKVGRILKEVDENGLVTMYQYSGNGEQKWERIIHPGPQPETIGGTLPEDCIYTEKRYNIDGTVSVITGSAVVETSFVYTVDPNTGFQNKKTYMGPDGVTSVRYSIEKYDWLGRIIQETLPPAPGNSTERVSTTEYYPTDVKGAGKIKRTTSPSPQNLNEFISTLYEYDEFGELWRTVLDVNKNGIIDLNGLDRITETDTHYEGNEEWLVTTQVTYANDGSNASTQVSKTKSRISNFSPGMLDEIIIIDSAGNTTVQNQILHSTKHVIKSTFPANISNGKYEQFGNGRLYAVYEPDGHTTSFSYDCIGRIANTYDSRTGWSSINYEIGKNRVSFTEDPAGRIQRTYYYENHEIGAGRVSATTDPVGGIIRSAYDTMGRTIAQWGSGTQPVKYIYSEYGELQQQCTYRDDSAWWNNGIPVNSIPASSTADGFVYFEYDAASGMIMARKDGDYSNWDITSFYYYPGGGQSCIQRYKGADSTQPVASYSSYSDSTGELFYVSYSDDTPWVFYSYDRLGRMKTVSDAVTGTRQFIYTAFGSLEREEFVNNNFYHQPNVEHIYASHEFDETRQCAGIPAGVNLHVSGVLALRNHSVYNWNNGQTLISVADPSDPSIQDGLEAHYTYLENTSMKSTLNCPIVAGGNMQINYNYEQSRNVLQSISTSLNGQSISSYDYLRDDIGRVVRSFTSGRIAERYLEQNETGLWTESTYNNRSQLTSCDSYLGTGLQTWNPSMSIPGRNFIMNYDGAGNRIEHTNNGSSSEETVDSRNRLISKSISGIVPVSGFAGDQATPLVNGLVSPVSRRGDYFYHENQIDNSLDPKSGQISVHAVKAGAGPALVSEKKRSFFLPKTPIYYQYDGRGNLIADGQWNYQWDGASRLVSVERSPEAIKAGAEAVRLEFAYDYSGKRVAKVVKKGHNGQSFTQVNTTLYAWVGNRLALEMDGSGTIKRKYFWRNGSSQAGGLQAISDYTGPGSPQHYYPAFDGNGNLVSLVNALDGTVSAFYEYSPFGEILRSGGGAIAQDNPLRGGTQLYDTETDLYCYQFRYYSPATGRWLSRDPLGEAGGRNLYAFCGNNPLNSVDLLGLCGSGTGSGEAMSAEEFEMIWSKFFTELLKMGGSFLDYIPGASMRNLFYQHDYNFIFGWSDSMLRKMDEFSQVREQTPEYTTEGTVTWGEATVVPDTDPGLIANCIGAASDATAGTAKGYDDPNPSYSEGGLIFTTSITEYNVSGDQPVPFAFKDDLGPPMGVDVGGRYVPGKVTLVVTGIHRATPYSIEYTVTGVTVTFPTAVYYNTSNWSHRDGSASLEVQHAEYQHARDEWRARDEIAIPMLKHMMSRQYVGAEKTAERKMQRAVQDILMKAFLKSGEFYDCKNCAHNGGENPLPGDFPGFP